MTPGTFWVESEFTNGLTATCGPCARAMAVSWANQAYDGALPNQTATYRSYLRMRSLGDCDSNGASNGGGIRDSLSRDNFKTLRQGFGASDWLSFARARFAEPAVVVAELSRGQALRDEISGQGMDASNLQYHWHTWLDYHPGGYSPRAGRTLPEGIWVADGDNGATNPVVSGVRKRVVAGHNLQFYSVSTLAAAAPVDLIAVYPKVSMSVSAPAGLGAGFAAKYVALGMTVAVTVPETYYNDHESVAVFADGTVFYYNSQSNEIIADTSRGPKAPSIINGLVLAYLAEKNKPAPAPVVTPPDPALVAKAAKYDAIKAALQ